jgi:hypothetical protein
MMLCKILFITEKSFRDLNIQEGDVKYVRKQFYREKNVAVKQSLSIITDIDNANL